MRKKYTKRSNSIQSKFKEDNMVCVSFEILLKERRTKHTQNGSFVPSFVRNVKNDEQFVFQFLSSPQM